MMEHVTRACIFDMDGVLIDSGAHHRDAWRALLEELGAPPAEPEYWRLTIGRPAEEAVPLLLGAPATAAQARRLALRAGPKVERRPDEATHLHQPGGVDGIESIRGVAGSGRHDPDALDLPEVAVECGDEARCALVRYRNDGGIGEAQAALAGLSMVAAAAR
jgi:hypothetical protein